MLAVLTTAAAAGLAIYVSREAYSQGGLFAWHPFCMSVGAIALSTAGVHAVRSRRSVPSLGAKTTRVQVGAVHVFCAPVEWAGCP